MTRMLCALTVALAAWMLPTTTAHAATYCVSAPAGCSGITPSPDTVQRAITLALDPTTPEDDTIVVDAGTFPANHVEVPANSDGRLTIQGAGPAQTRFTRTPAEAEVRIQDDLATLRDVGIEIPSGSFHRALTLYQGRAESIAITEGAGSSSNSGIVMGEGAVAAGVSVNLVSNNSVGMEVFFAGDGRIEDARINACTGIVGNTAGTATAERVYVRGNAGFRSIVGNLITDSSAVRIDDRGGICTNHPWGIASVGDFSSGRSLQVNHTTVHGTGAALQRGVRLLRTGGVDPLLAIARSSVFADVGQTIESTTATAEPIATMKFSASAFAASATSQPGFDTGSFPNVHDPVLGFRDANDGVYELTHESGLVDRGEMPLPAGLSTTDLLGAPRSRNGKPLVNGNDARPDIGAHEYTPGLPAVTGSVAPGSAGIGEALAFSATGSSGEPAIVGMSPESVSYAWTFDDGTVASGASVSKAFSTAGPHTATVTVTDASGWTDSDTVAFDVTAPPASPSSPPASPGGGSAPVVPTPSRRTGTPAPLRVGFVRRTSTVDRRGRAPVGLRCPANAPRRCAGRLTLTVVRRIRGRRRSVVVGRATFAIEPGRTATPRVRLASSIRSRMRRARRFTVRAEAKVTGGQTTSATLVVRPRRR